MLTRINIVSLVMFSVVLDMYAMENQNTLKTLPVKLTSEQADYIFRNATKEEVGFLYTISDECFIQVSRESLLAHELKKQLFLQNHSDRL